MFRLLDALHPHANVNDFYWHIHVLAFFGISSLSPYQAAFDQSNWLHYDPAAITANAAGGV